MPSGLRRTVTSDAAQRIRARAGCVRVGAQRVNALLGTADALEMRREVLADHPVRVGERRPVRELPGRRVVVDQIGVADRFAGAASMLV